MEISVELSDSLYGDISQLARTKKKTVAEFVNHAVRKAVADEIEISVRQLADCSDEEVLTLANMKMSDAENKRMSELLDKQREETISPLEKNELNALIRVFQVGNLRKSQGIDEAVFRGLIKSPNDLR